MASEQQDKAKTDQSSGGTPSAIATEEQGQSNLGKTITGQSSGGTPSNAASEELRQSNPPEMELKTAKEKAQKAADKILKQLRTGTEEAIVLTGSSGIGKTWLAKEITKSAVSTEGSFYMSLWISLKEKHEEDYQSLHHSIARQLSIPTIGGVWEDADDIDDEKEKEDFAESLTKLKPRVEEKLFEKMKELKKEIKNNQKIGETKHTFLLLVLDSEGRVNNADYVYIRNELIPSEDLKKKTEVSPEVSFSIKVLITSRDGVAFVSKDSIRVVEIEPLSGDEAVAFLEQRVGDDVSKPSKFKTICDAIKERNKVLPAQIIMLAEALNRIAKDGPEAQERAFDAALDILKHPDKDDAKPLLRFIYEKLPDDCVIDCFWHSWNFLGKHGGVQYNELITHWMLEGHIDLADGIKKAYEKGYSVMMELIDRGMLKMQEDNLIVLEGATLALEDRSCRGLFEKSNLGLPGLLEGKKREVFERMAAADGMIRTVSVDKTGKSVSSLLIDGSRLCREDPETFLQAKQDLKVLALFYPRLTSLPKPISEMKNLLVLVLRDCYLLNDTDVERIRGLKELVVLEISGAPSLKIMPDDLFENMSQLRSLNLSALGIKSLPPSVSSLSELRRLILRKCPFLKDLPKLVKLQDLEVIDLSGSCSLEKIQEKSFKSFQKLRFIDFSGTKIEKLPIVQTLPNLTLLLVRGCNRLAGLRFMKHLHELKVLDVSGATRIKEIYYDCFDDTDNLRILDLSETEIRFLPDSLGKHLCDLRLKGCPKLEKLPSTTALTDLQSLDLSNSSGLQKFPDKFFENLSSLQSLNLSNSKVASFPSLSNLHNLRRLLLKGCSFEKLPESKTFGNFEGLNNLVELDLSDCKSPAEQLPSLEGLKFLEVINLSGYKALSEIDASFEHMPWLQVLDLSETQISSLPSLCNPSKLRSLILNNCTKLQLSLEFQNLSELEHLDLRGISSLKDVKAESLSHLTRLQTLKLSKIALEAIQSDLENLKQLEVLDLSGEAVESLPPLDRLSNLRQLLLRGCSSLKELPSLNSLSHLEVLDLSGTKVKKLGTISQLTNIKRLHLPEEVIEEFKAAENVKCLPLELKLDCCCISKPSEIPEQDKKPRIVVHGTGLLKSLKEIHAQSKDEDNYGDSRKHIFSDIYSKIRKLPFEAEDGESLEIHGFDDFPTDIEVLLEHANYFLLVGNSFFKNLSDLRPDSLKNIKGCWLERCNKIECIFMEADVGKWERLEILWISNLPKLKSLYEEKVQSLSFENLKHLYIDCCPTLETVFSSGQIPENLETLRITFCDGLKTLFGDKVSANKEEQTSASTNMKVQTPSSAEKEVPTTSSTNKKVQTTGSAEKEVKARTIGSAKKEVQTKSSIDKEVEAQSASSADKEVQAQTMSLADKEVQAQATNSADKEVEAQTTSSADKEVQAQTMSLADKEVQAQTTSSADKEVEAQTTSSTDKEVEAQTTSSADKEVQAQTMSSADKEVQAQTKGLADKEVQAMSAADKEVQAQTMSLADKEVQAQTMSLADKEVQATSSADKEVQAQIMSSADKEVQATSSADKEVQAQTMSSADKEVQALTMSSADKEVQAMSSADKEVQAQTMSSADKEVQATSSGGKEVQAQTTSSVDKEVQATSSADKKVQAQTTSSANKEVQAQSMSSADKQVQTKSRTNLKHLHISYCPMLETVFSSAQAAQLPKNLEILQIKYCDKLKSLFEPELNNPELPDLHTLHLLELPAWTTPAYGFKWNESDKKDVKVSRKIEESLRSDNASKETTRATRADAN